MELSELESAFEAAGYDVVETTRNRDRVRIGVREAGADAGDLRALVTDTVGEDGVLGLAVEAESVDGTDGMNTVVTFRYRG